MAQLIGSLSLATLMASGKDQYHAFQSLAFPFAPYRTDVSSLEIEPNNGKSHMSNLKANYLAITLIFSLISSVFGQWSPVDSGTTSNLNGAILLDSGTGFVVGDTGTILKSTDAGATWSPLTSGTSTTLHGIYFLDPNEGVAVGDSGTILRTTDGGVAWQSIASGVKIALDQFHLTGQTGSAEGTRRISFTRPTPAPHGRSVRVDSLVADSRALRC